MEPENQELLYAEIQRLRQEIEVLRTQHATPTHHASAPYTAPTPHYDPIEPNVSLPAKFDGTKSHCRDFLNQVRLIFQLQPRRYPDDRTRIGFIGTLLTGTAAAWFSPLFENNSPSLTDFARFTQEFEENFGDFDRATTAANQIRNLRQGFKTASEYAANFRRISCDLRWGEGALIDQFRHGLNNEIKDLLLTLPIPVTLQEAITSAVRCDNRLIERRNERHTEGPFIPRSNFINGPTPMELDATRIRFGKLTPEEKSRRRNSGLCLYCGKPGHVASNCPAKKPGNAQVRQQ